MSARTAPVDPRTIAERKADLETERTRVLDAIREHGPIHLADLAPILGAVHGTSLHWHVLILSDRGLVVWEDRVTSPKVRAA